MSSIILIVFRWFQINFRQPTLSRSNTTWITSKFNSFHHFIISNNTWVIWISYIIKALILLTPCQLLTWTNSNNILPSKITNISKLLTISHNFPPWIPIWMNFIIPLNNNKFKSTKLTNFLSKTCTLNNITITTANLILKHL